ncbi:hypothetical protein ACLOJK_023936, partial [Asimina triloba]
MDEASMKWATPLESADINVSIIAINRKPSACKRAPNDCCPFGQQAASISTASNVLSSFNSRSRPHHAPAARSSRASVRIPSSSSMPKWPPSQAADASPSPSCTNPPGSIHPNRPKEQSVRSIADPAAADGSRRTHEQNPSVAMPSSSADGPLIDNAPFAQNQQQSMKQIFRSENVGSKVTPPASVRLQQATGQRSSPVHRAT